MEGRSQTTLATRERILRAASDVVTEIGVDALTMQAVAERADVALRTLYNHFESREALALAVYEQLSDATRLVVEKLSLADTPRERLLAFVAGFYELFEQRGPGAAAAMAITTLPEVAARLHEVRTWRTGELTALLRLAARDGSLRLPLKPAVALAFVMTNYVTWQAFVQERGLSPAAAVRLAQDVLDQTLFGPRPDDTD